jgi:hypothetical protein
MSWHHCSAADGVLCGGGLLLSRCRAATSVASAAVATMLAECWCCGAATPAAAAARLLARRDRPTLKWEVASPSGSHEMNIHHDDEAGTPKTTEKAPLVRQMFPTQKADGFQMLLVF